MSLFILKFLKIYCEPIGVLRTTTNGGRCSEKKIITIKFILTKHLVLYTMIEISSKDRILKIAE